MDPCPRRGGKGSGGRGSPDGVMPEMRVGQWSDFEPRNMNRYFNETAPPNFPDLPISYQVNPFVWRNDQECDDPMPNDRDSIDYYARDLKWQTDDTYPRRDHELRGGESHTAQSNSRSSSPATGAEKSSGVNSSGSALKGIACQVMPPLRTDLSKSLMAVEFGQ